MASIQQPASSGSESGSGSDVAIDERKRKRKRMLSNRKLARIWGTRWLSCSSRIAIWCRRSMPRRANPPTTFSGLSMRNSQIACDPWTWCFRWSKKWVDSPGIFRRFLILWWTHRSSSVQMLNPFCSFNNINSNLSLSLFQRNVCVRFW